METVEEAPGPVLVSAELLPKKRRTRSTLPPAAETSSQKVEPSLPEPAPALPSGDPDHSLVPKPRKKNLPAREAVEYWASVPQRERDEWFIAYVYRDIPACDPTQVLTLEELRAIERGKKKKPELNCGKVTEPFDPDGFVRQFQDRYGAGAFHVRLNDQHPSIKTTIVEFDVDAGRDWDNHPPAIDDLGTVVLDDPLNASYVRWAHLKGIKFPGEPGSPDNPQPLTEEEDDMANVSAVVESNKHLTDRVIEMSKEATSKAPTAPAPTEVANTRAVEVIADAATKAQKMMLDGIQAAQQSQTKAQDPAEFHKAVVEAAKAMTPPAASGNDALFLQMMKMQQDNTNALIAQMEKRLESSEKRAEEALNRLTQQQAPPPVAPVAPESPVKTALELIKGLATLRDAAAPILGGNGDPTDGMPTWAKLVDKGLDALPGVVHNLTVMKTGQGTAAPPPDLEVTDEPEPAKPDATPQLNTAQENNDMFSNRRIAEALAAPLIESLNRGDRGFQFAAGMILQPSIMGFPGSVVYEMALSKGKDGMYQILQSYPELWQKLVQIPKKFDAYLEDFLNADMARAIAANERHPQPAPVVEVTPEVLPKANGAPAPPKTGGRTIIGGNGAPIQTA